MHLSASVGLHFDGECETAFKFYERLLDLKLELVLPWSATPLASQAPAGWSGVLFARLRGSSMTLLGADALPGTYQPPTGFTLTLNAADQAEAERLFNELAQSGTVGMPLQETFFALRYGMVVDRFGIPWEIRCGKPHEAAD